MQQISLIKNTEQPLAKPFLKWAGGKRQLLNLFQQLYPPALKANKIKNYYEPFLGSAAVFFDIVQKYKIENAFLYDVNPELVLTYKVIQEQPVKLIECLMGIQKKYLRLDNEKRTAYYYKQRTLFNRQLSKIDFDRFNEAWITRAAQTIFLNRTCYNGLFRVNAKGAFNTPAGNYSRPVICDTANLMAVSKLLQTATIKRADYSQILKDLQPKAFVYFDPPYRPLSKTAAFTAYSQFAFGDTQQQELAALFAKLHKKKVAVMLSNSDPANFGVKDAFFDDLYRNFAITRVPAKRLINSNAALRGTINEIVVTNYPVSMTS
jgi:DNA adenine methylase